MRQIAYTIVHFNCGKHCLLLDDHQALHQLPTRLITLTAGKRCLLLDDHQALHQMPMPHRGKYNLSTD
jgi:hypothetical protein